MDPKFRWIIIGFSLTLIVACVSLNVYAWQPRVIHPSEEWYVLNTLYNALNLLVNSHKGNGLYLHNSEKCIELTGSIDRCLGEGMCMCFDRWFPEARATCQNCTLCKGYAPPKPPTVAPPGQQPPGSVPSRPLPPTSRPLPPNISPM